MGDISGTLYFNAPGFKSDSVEIAPTIDPLKTKRKPLIDKEVRVHFIGGIFSHTLYLIISLYLYRTTT